MTAPMPGGGRLGQLLGQWGQIRVALLHERGGLPLRVRRLRGLGAGLAAVMPIAIGLAMNVRLGEDSRLTGLWGSFFAIYWREWFGGIGAWVVVVLAISTLTATTLAWNPIRMLIGHHDVAVADLHLGMSNSAIRRLHAHHFTCAKGLRIELHRLLASCKDQVGLHAVRALRNRIGLSHRKSPAF